MPVRGRLWLERIVYAEACVKTLTYKDHLCGISMSAYLSQVYVTYSFIFLIVPDTRGRDTSLELTETLRIPAQSLVSYPSEWIQSKCGKNGSGRCFLS